MHDDVAGIDQHPIGAAGSFDLNTLETRLVQFLQQVLGHRGDLTIGKASRYNHAVAERRLAFQVERDDILGLVIFQAADDHVLQPLQLRGLADRCRGNFAGPRHDSFLAGGAWGFVGGRQRLRGFPLRRLFAWSWDGRSDRTLDYGTAPFPARMALADALCWGDGRKIQAGGLIRASTGAARAGIRAVRR